MNHCQMQQKKHQKRRLSTHCRPREFCLLLRFILCHSILGLIKKKCPMIYFILKIPLSDFIVASMNSERITLCLHLAPLFIIPCALKCYRVWWFPDSWELKLSGPLHVQHHCPASKETLRKIRLWTMLHCVLHQSSKTRCGSDILYTACKQTLSVMYNLCVSYIWHIWQIYMRQRPKWS